MKALSIAQPWAFATVCGAKRVENRTWHTNYRGPLLIHAGKTRKWFTSSSVNQLRDAGLHLSPHDDCPYGALVGRCRLVACRYIGDAGIAAMPFAKGPWCWLLADIVRFNQPIPYKGQRGLFEVPDEVLGNKATAKAPRAPRSPGKRTHHGARREHGEAD